MKKILLVNLLVLLFIGCKKKTNQEEDIPKEPKLQQRITHYYSIKEENGEVVRDTIKNCFSCNQALIFDKSGKELELRFYKANMKDIYGYEVYEHDANGNKIGSNYYDIDSLTTEYKYELDKNNRIKIGRAFEIATGNLLYGYINLYDKNGNHIETGNMDAKGEVYQYYRRQFNKKGVAIRETIEDLEGNPRLRIKYEYRPKANKDWEEQLTYYNDTLKEIRFREKIYFK